MVYEGMSNYGYANRMPIAFKQVKVSHETRLAGAREDARKFLWSA